MEFATPTLRKVIAREAPAFAVLVDNYNDHTEKGICEMKRKADALQLRALKLHEMFVNNMGLCWYLCSMLRWLSS